VNNADSITAFHPDIFSSSTKRQVSKLIKIKYIKIWWLRGWEGNLLKNRKKLGPLV